jgi:hypothetical protein
MTKQNKKRLVDLAMNVLKEKYPSFPDHAIPIPKYSDKTANGLTKCIKDFVNNSGWQAERINTTGRPIDRTKIVTDVVGFQRTVGSVEWVKGTGTKGSADLSCVIAGKSVKAEIKIGKDRQSEHQKKYEQGITQAGGVYIIVKDFDEFIEWYDNFIQTL